MRTRYKGQDENLSHKDNDHFDTRKSAKWLRQSNEELEEVDLNKLMRLLK